jgi:hypothetical protein
VLENSSDATDLDLISYLKAIWDAMIRRRMHFTHRFWFQVRVLGILIDCRSSLDRLLCLAGSS